MQDFSPENFWWNNITGPSEMITSAENALSEGYSIILGVPAFTPWPEKMRNVLHGNLSGGDVYITIINADSECPGSAEDYLLSKYDTSRKYRSRLSSVQEFFLRNNSLRNHIFWVHNFRDKSQVSDWLNFCTKYPSDSSAKGLFILDTEHENLLPAGRMRAVNFSDYAESYDTMIFASFLLDNKEYSRPLYTRSWKRYLSSLAAMLCGSDAEVAERFLRSADFTCSEPLNVLQMIADDFPERCADSTHILGMLNDDDESAVMNRIWTAQVQVFFPMIELVVGEILNRKPSDLALIALLKEKDGADEGLRCLPVLVGPLEAQAIIVNLFRHRIPHPGIYDLYLNTLKQFDGNLTEVDIYRISGGIFYSHLFIERDGNTSFITCRTSDAIALAVRNNTPIYIEEDLLERNCVRLQSDGAYSLPITTASTKVLKEAMEQAIATENYEFAARLRDEINSRGQADESDMDLI